MEKVNILGVKVDMVTVVQAADEIFQMLSQNRPHWVFTPNSEIIMQAYKSDKLRSILNRADLLTADGIGVVHASKFLKNPIKERAPGYDIACLLIEKIARSGHRLFLFGGRDGVAEIAKKKLEERYPFIQIVGVRSGYFRPAEEPKIIKEINDSRADVVFVCLGAPAQEYWIAKHSERTGARVFMGLGGSIDVIAGTVERAPRKWADKGFEWLYRLLQQPSRFWRMLALPKFAFTVLVKGRKFIKDENDEE